ncbi:MAG: MerR family transcriptional regulator [Candidatus Aminicenantes bacterium]|nr:MerR family transcriptional regulator [Candidatus Aminicenantes bacterium]NIM78487.1 MerR family transcriptional regulator [Candidatus Aminicenantes bacterium]NIN19908.1 MerR family transcriptional regulator [Candidatus Aminicenantes bacterium]NIN41625.1 MerR family transcriptional regulator [Candidatus Aminicenantes bacterium]NIN86534.1 MerR family transcriptional regulator [Candidatus Aminicenantes bacterium]
MNINIPDKLTFKRNEVIKLTKLEGRVLDYWEKEFGGFVPTVNPTGEKFYSRKDVELILKIKHWMVVERIEKSKVKEKIKQEGEGWGVNAANVPGAGGNEGANSVGAVELKQIPRDFRDKLRIIRQNLQEILTILDKNDK